MSTEVTPGKINIPIVLGDVLVTPGDLIFADNDSVVVVPSTQVEAVYSKTKARENAEDAQKEGIEGKHLPTKFNTKYAEAYKRLGLSEEPGCETVQYCCTAYTEMVPEHFHLRQLAEYVKQGIYEAGGIPRKFNTIAVCDGICQGHKGMKHSLMSREVIADTIDCMIEAHHFDAMVMMLGCDKIVPGMLMAAMRLNIPAIFVPGGTMMPGKYKD